jgi:hypothetical protein
MKKFSIFIIFIFLFSFGCTNQEQQNELIDEEIIERESKIPINNIKMTPELDLNPPKSHSSEYENPVQLPYPINTAGGEDSAFIIPNGNTLYFWFTPDVNIPPEKQLIDKVTGIYVSHKINGEWSKPEKIILQNPNKLALDGCAFIEGNIMWFCSVREGYEEINWFFSEFNLEKEKWENWEKANFPKEYEIGELHIYENELYFHSNREGGKGGLDIWVSKKVNGEWSEPENLENVNSERDEGWPALSPDGNEIWISKDYGLWRSKKINGEWSEPELMFSPLAGEASIDIYGNVYFTHHFFDEEKMIEADIYVAKKKNN